MRGESYDPRLAHGCEGGGGERNFLHCMNLVRKQDDPTARRGAVVKAMCVCSQYNYIEVGRGSLLLLGSGCCFHPAGSKDFADDL